MPIATHTGQCFSTAPIKVQGVHTVQYSKYSLHFIHCPMLDIHVNNQTYFSMSPMRQIALHIVNAPPYHSRINAQVWILHTTQCLTYSPVHSVHLTIPRTVLCLIYCSMCYILEKGIRRSVEQRYQRPPPRPYTRP